MLFCCESRLIVHDSRPIWHNKSHASSLADSVSSFLVVEGGIPKPRSFPTMFSGTPNSDRFYAKSLFANCRIFRDGLESTHMSPRGVTSSIDRGGYPTGG
ncbi:hypothetical protein DMR_32490 [Solidesulfovibrio magneticus RS-1]|uniref:Uncharacterized protein n=1 Tax=Solidesulfovibrio magneticus (strain ATCC 700980 / DSM 13731 / RS-1) TaxID=573370 RepID=C4XJJ0_SOLM1|nr:hypothetical protein DMR_32490 [Solidesulfovibrio magneticus RS-1]